METRTLADVFDRRWSCGVVAPRLTDTEAAKYGLPVQDHR